jgi:hypothetical protein
MLIGAITSNSQLVTESFFYLILFIVSLGVGLMMGKRN